MCAADRSNHAARSISGKDRVLPLFGGHSISNLLLLMASTSRSPSTANAVTRLPPRCRMSPSGSRALRERNPFLPEILVCGGRASSRQQETRSDSLQRRRAPGSEQQSPGSAKAARTTGGEGDEAANPDRHYLRAPISLIAQQGRMCEPRTSRTAPFWACYSVTTIQKPKDSDSFRSTIYFWRRYVLEFATCPFDRGTLPSASGARTAGRRH